MLEHYPILIEAISGMITGALFFVGVRSAAGRTCFIAFLLATTLMRAFFCGTVDMNVVLDHLLGDLAKILTWVIAHQALSLGFTLGFVVASTINMTKPPGPTNSAAATP